MARRPYRAAHWWVVLWQLWVSAGHHLRDRSWKQRWAISNTAFNKAWLMPKDRPAWTFCSGVRTPLNRPLKRLSMLFSGSCWTCRCPPAVALMTLASRHLITPAAYVLYRLLYSTYSSRLNTRLLTAIPPWHGAIFGHLQYRLPYLHSPWRAFCLVVHDDICTLRVPPSRHDFSTVVETRSFQVSTCLSRGAIMVQNVCSPFCMPAG